MFDVHLNASGYRHVSAEACRITWSVFFVFTARFLEHALFGLGEAADTLLADFVEDGVHLILETVLCILHDLDFLFMRLALHLGEKGFELDLSPVVEPTEKQST